jgi:hypothetical protein
MYRATCAALVLLVTACGDAGRPVEPLPKPVQTVSLVSGTDLVGVAGHEMESFVVIVRDSLGEPVPGAPVRFETDAILHGEIVVNTDAAGLASKDWQLGWQPTQYTISATIPSTGQRVLARATASANPLARVLRLEANPGSRPQVVVVRDGAAQTIPLIELTSHFPPDVSPGPSDLAMAFAVGSAPTVVPLAWGPFPDTLVLTLREPLMVHITAWILEDFATNAAIAQRNLNTTAGWWAGQRWGLVMGSTVIMDATAYDGPPLLCEQLPPFALGGTINVYYTTRFPVPGGQRCQTDKIIINPVGSNTYTWLLAHELGHSLDLWHNGLPSNFMGPVGGFGMTIGQVQTAHFSPNSALNVLWGYRSAAEMATCCLAITVP